MVDLASAFGSIRSVMAKFPTLEAHNPSQNINLEDIYFPLSHAEVLDPDRSIVIGNRGMGKSFWSSALVDPALRNYITQQRSGWWRSRAKFDAFFGFADAEGAGGTTSARELEELRRFHNADDIWRAITLEQLAPLAETELPRKLLDRCNWVKDNGTETREIFRNVDLKLSKENKKIIFIFDQLDRLSSIHNERRDLTESILKLALAFKSYRNLRLKIFMRPDHYLEDTLFRFPDASKIRGESIDLLWAPTDLYGLLFQRLIKEAKADFELLLEVPYPGASIEDLVSSRDIFEDDQIQHDIFDIIADSEMGSKKRGRPYIWLMTHLSDARNQVSPRTFLRALRYSAERKNSLTDKVINHLDIYEGVRKASENRVDDLKEDYPWVQPALAALQGLSVPCFPGEMIEKWRSSTQFMTSILRLSSHDMPSWFAGFNPEKDDDYRLLIQSLEQIGVIERRITTGKVNIPDIFRLGANLKRKGGVTPQQRRKIRKTSNVFD